MIVHNTGSPAGLDIVDGTTPTCAAASSRGLAGPGSFGTYAAGATRTDGRPVIADCDADNDGLRLRICANPDCL